MIWSNIIKHYNQIFYAPLSNVNYNIFVNYFTNDIDLISSTGYSLQTNSLVSTLYDSQVTGTSTFYYEPGAYAYDTYLLPITSLSIISITNIYNNNYLNSPINILTGTFYTNLQINYSTNLASGNYLINYSVNQNGTSSLGTRSLYIV